MKCQRSFFAARLRGGVCRIMTVETLRCSGNGLSYHVIVGGFFVELRGLRMAIQADGVIIGLAHLDWEFVSAGGFFPDMAEAGFFGLHRAENSVVGVAAVTLLPLNVAILIMQRSKCLAGRILQVIDEGLHDVA